MATDDIFGPSQPEEKGIGHEVGTLFRSFRNILIKKFRINLIVFAIIVAIAVAGTIFLRDPSITGAAIGFECPEQECPECAVCEVASCEELNCSLKDVQEVIVNKFFYVCEDSGAIVNKSEDCEPIMPQIDSMYVETANGITFSIDDWVIDFDNETSGRIKTLDYTIINKGFKKIEPRIKIYLYEGSWADADRETKFGFYTNKIIGSDVWIRETKKLNLFFSMKNPKVRFELIDDLQNDKIVAVVKRIDTD